MTDDLLTRIDRLERHDLARSMAATYAVTVDAGDAERIAALFAPDGTLTIPSGTLTGRAEIAAFYASRVADADRRHFVTNVATHPTETATQIGLSAYFLYTSREPGRSALGWGRYDDVIDTSGESPLLLAKTITPEVFTDLDDGWAS
ncbi:nuclear transport factor 2 family protein [Aeromicrobium sp. YIM 150415]|uniref:nuclear transport factor 2 family protein n=1 Tax=Aeromicrobium sp. YIM 150415 TaxID=2803912 RepID=UPI0019625CFD|nr:nuclear transport factor 2 family protein [Aeromicrobium sp. YIM 150415]MBM9465596.1 nuclear transport factor 2 family protein [Aeromicrobium sp. YIM 150415]